MTAMRPEGFAGAGIAESFTAESTYEPDLQALRLGLSLTNGGWSWVGSIGMLMHAPNLHSSHLNR